MPLKRFFNLAARKMRPPQRPLVAVIGATGTGKSQVFSPASPAMICHMMLNVHQLAVEIARRFNGEIINGDAMQLYEGLPIITNKIKEDEKKGVPHHLLGCIGLREETWTVGTFVEKASKIVRVGS